jgi:hypothetical protein
VTDGDLDALIGEVRMEAARRRASPDFPIGRDAELAAELDRLGPAGGGDLASILEGLDRLAAAAGAPAAAAPAAAAGAPDATGAAEVAGLAAAAVRALSMRLRSLERRAGEPRTARRPGPVGDLSSGEAPAVLSRWGDELVAAACGAGEGRVLVIGADAEPWVRLLHAAGVDAYGVDPTLAAYGDRGAVRAGRLSDHLASVGESALRLAVVVGPLPVDEIPALREVAEALRRVAASVVVVSESPWSWRLRVGPPAEDMSPARPLTAETWLAELSAAGFEATAGYSPRGDSYRVAARGAGR